MPPLKSFVWQFLHHKASGINQTQIMVVLAPTPEEALEVVDHKVPKGLRDIFFPSFVPASDFMKEGDSVLTEVAKRLLERYTPDEVANGSLQKHWMQTPELVMLVMSIYYTPPPVKRPGLGSFLKTVSESKGPQML